MADYEFKYQLIRAPEPTVDGSECVLHDVQAVARIAGSTDPFVPVGGRHKTIAVPATELATVLAMSNNGAKATAYKNALATNLDTQTVPITGWGLAELEAFMDANDIAVSVALAADSYITDTLHLSYPVQFSM